MSSPLIEYADVTNRLARVPALTLPTTVTPERIQDYIQEATGSLLNASGYDDPPSSGSRQRDALDGLCVRLVVNAIRLDLMGDDAQMAETLRRERRDLLEEAGTVENAASREKAMFQIAGATP